MLDYQILWIVPDVCIGDYGGISLILTSWHGAATRRRKLVYRIKYDVGTGRESQDAMPYDYEAALAEIRKSLDYGVHKTATLECTSGEGPDRIISWDELRPILDG